MTRSIDTDNGPSSDEAVPESDTDTVVSTTVPDEQITDEADDPIDDERRSQTAASSAGRTRRSRKRAGGVAPMVRPPGRFARLRAQRQWGRRGFVPMSPGREKRRHRILPRTVIGIATMLACTGVGAAFSGAAFYAYYDDRLARNEESIALFVDGFDEQFEDAAGSLDQIRSDSVDQIRAEMAPLGEWAADANGIVELPVLIGDSIWIVETRDERGQSVIGTAFAVTGHNGGTALVTSLSLVRSSTTQPSPVITLVKGDRRETATLRTWDETHDLALLVTAAEIEGLDLASSSNQSSAIGQRVFAMSALGGQGATASPGALLDVSDLGLQHTALIGRAFVGGPLVTGDGIVVGVASLDYGPLGVDPGAVAIAPSIDAICAVVLRCADTEADELLGDLSLDEGGDGVVIDE